MELRIEWWCFVNLQKGFSPGQLVTACICRQLAQHYWFKCWRSMPSNSKDQARHRTAVKKMKFVQLQHWLYAKATSASKPFWNEKVPFLGLWLWNPDAGWNPMESLLLVRMVSSHVLSGHSQACHNISICYCPYVVTSRAGGGIQKYFTNSHLPAL